MRALIAIIKLTLKAAVRSRAVLILVSALALMLLGLPLLIHHDGTARMMSQVTLTYSFGFVVLILGAATLWMACGSLSSEMADRTIQLIVVKPVAAWQIWVGKWAGIMALNFGCLMVSAVVIILILNYQARGLSPEERQSLETQVLVSRGAVREPVAEIQDDIRQIRSRLNENESAALENEELEREIEKLAQARHEVVHPGFRRIWELQLGERRSGQLADVPLQIRTRFYAAQPPGEEGFLTRWQVGNNTTGVFWRTNMTQTQNVTHEFTIPPNLFDESGNLVVEFHNLNQTTLLFPMQEGLEVLFPEGSFNGNLVRACLVVLFWLSALAALGLWTSAFLSFPVAAFLVTAILILLSSGTMMSEIVQEGGIGGVDHETHEHVKSPFDWFIVPVFKSLLAILNLVKEVSPLESLGSGRSIPIQSLGLSFFKTVVVVGGLLAISGIAIFSRRELATVEEGT